MQWDLGRLAIELTSKEILQQCLLMKRHYLVMGAHIYWRLDMVLINQWNIYLPKLKPKVIGGGVYINFMNFMLLSCLALKIYDKMTNVNKARWQLLSTYSNFLHVLTCIYSASKLIYQIKEWFISFPKKLKPYTLQR